MDHVAEPQKSLRHGIVVTEQRGKVGTKRDARGAGQRGAIHQQRRVLRRSLIQQVAQDKPALGVGVADLHRQAGSGPYHVGRPHRCAGHGIFHAADAYRQADGQVGLHDDPGQAEDGRGAAHVLLHPQHAGGWLQVIAAGIETDAFAAERQQRRIVRRGAAAPVEGYNPRRSHRTASDRGDRREGFLQRRIREHSGCGAIAIRQRYGEVGQFDRSQDIGGRVDQIAHHPGRGGLRQARFDVRAETKSNAGLRPSGTKPSVTICA